MSSEKTDFINRGDYVFIERGCGIINSVIGSGANRAIRERNRGGIRSEMCFVII